MILAAFFGGMLLGAALVVGGIFLFEWLDNLEYESYRKKYMDADD